jgi:transcription antitermination protein NusB
MATRRQVREAVVSILYSSDMGNKSTPSAIGIMLEEKKIRNKQKEFALELVDGIERFQTQLDEKIVAVLKEWEWDRVGSIERSILRLGAYEIVYSEADRAVIINEAVEIAKLFGAENAPRFINGILDAIKKEA